MLEVQFWLLNKVPCAGRWIFVINPPIQKQITHSHINNNWMLNLVLPKNDLDWFVICFIVIVIKIVIIWQMDIYHITKKSKKVVWKVDVIYVGYGIISNDKMLCRHTFYEYVWLFLFGFMQLIDTTCSVYSLYWQIGGMINICDSNHFILDCCRRNIPRMITYVQ